MKEEVEEFFQNQFRVLPPDDRMTEDVARERAFVLDGHFTHSWYHLIRNP